jgi:hypothetical protein
VLHGWRAAGLAAETCNKRRTALLALFHALDGRGGSNPVRQAPKFRAPDPLPRGLAYDQIEKALAQLPRCKTTARLTLMAYTGMRPGQIMRLTPDDWDHRLHMITVPGTAKGRGTKAYVIPLSSQARAALKEFDALDAWGAFTWAPMARMWKEAWIAATLKKKRSRCAALTSPATRAGALRSAALVRDGDLSGDGRHPGRTEAARPFDAEDDGALHARGRARSAGGRDQGVRSGVAAREAEEGLMNVWQLSANFRYPSRRVVLRIRCRAQWGKVASLTGFEPVFWP